MNLWENNQNLQFGYIQRPIEDIQPTFYFSKHCVIMENIAR